MPGPTSKTVRRETSHAERRDGIPQTLLFFILKQLEGPPSGASNQQDTLK